MAARPRLVLVGAGHAHAVTLRRWWREGAPEVDLVVVADRPDTLYSGMVPGWVAGEYERSDLVMDAGVMAERVGGRLVPGRAVEIDAERRRIELADGTALPYDIASLDVGSTVRLPGVDGPHAPVSARRPDEVMARLQALGTSTPRRACAAVVGGGAAGVELAACLRGRGVGRVTLFEADANLMGGYDPSVSARVARALERRGVAVRRGVEVRPVDSGALHVDDGETLTTDLTLWATGPGPPPLLSASDLPTDEDGFVLVRQDLRVSGHDDLFAAGDCASFGPAAIPKTGVHAVRQGEVLFRNLVAAVSAIRDGAGGVEAALMSRYEPQSDFLTLLNLGDGTALGTKWGYAVEGRWVRWLKDVIDRRFVERFQG